MVGEYSYCPVETKQHLKNKVALCTWSPKTDLIALGFCNGVVSVHRYKMVCIWESPTTSDSDDITQLVWRPDGKSLACAYRSGRMCLFLANDGFVYYELRFAGAVTHLSWTTIDRIAEQTRSDGTNAATFFPDFNCLNTVESDSSLNSGSDMSKFAQLLSNSDRSLTLLTVYSCNTLHFYGCDSFEIARWCVKSSLYVALDSKPELLDCRFSACQRYLLILYRWLSENGETCLELQRIPCDGLIKLGAQVREISLLHSSIRICKELLDKSFGQICTSWEDTILEMDVKFTKYAKERLSRNKNWSLCVELLEFILFGNCPASLRKFLVEDWTAPSLKRTGTATLKAYESIKTICFQQLQLILQRLLFHSSTLLGKLRDTQRYEPFGIPADNAIMLCSTVGSVLQKTQELHLVIEKSVTHLRGFFKWIYVANPSFPPPAYLLSVMQASFNPE
ncbi:anaphase-promoting complex subunit 4 [Paragonimus westermani]|uniref:Anaphase-promoting complex subunit 4 n=1 Tax=Paragonimus westermani TaxID=34504 RepID=A0A5J4P2L6_9TREM|nr:anaphase-promoting complex subunit 4 [Paragonimus westermani]